jgi:hypothetical protein
VFVGVVFADALQVHGLGLQVARALGGGDDEGAAGIGDQAAVQHAQRIGDGLRVQHLSQRDRLLHVRVGMQQRMGAGVDRDVRHLLARGAVHVHVALGDHGVVARDRAAVGLLEVGMADSQQRRQGGVAREAGGAVLAGAYQDGLGLAGGDGFGRVLEHHRRTGAAGDHRGIEARLEAQVFAQHRAEHEVRLGEGIGGEHAVDVRHLQAGVVQRALGGLGVQAQAGHVGNLADVGLADADDGDLVLQGCRGLHSLFLLRPRRA